MWLQSFAKVVTTFAFKIAYDMNFEGLENIPKNGGFLMCANHRANIDPVFIAQRTKCDFRFMAKAELFKNPLIGWFLRKIGAFPVERGKGDMTAINTAKEAIAEGNTLVMFPEGTRSKDGQLLKFKSGATMIASQTNADIMPVGINFEGKLRFRSKVTVRYGKLIKNEELGIKNNTPGELKYARNLLRDRIAALIDTPVQE